MKRIIGLVLIFVMCFSTITPAATNTKHTVKFLNQYALDEWGILALYSNGSDIRHRELSEINSNITTDYEAYILGAIPLGKDVSKEVKKILNAQNSQGKFADNIDGKGSDLVNAHIWGVISLYAAGEDRYDQAKALKWLKDKQNKDGGFSVFTDSNSSDIDMTAMGIVAYKILGLQGDSPEVQNALKFIQGNIDKNPTCESISWYILAQNMLGLEIEKSIYNKLLEYRGSDAGFKHLKRLKKSNYMATWHGLLAINDYDKGISIFTRLHNVSNFINQNKLNINKQASTNQVIILTTEFT
jgi:hypothetical protein